MRSVLLTLLLLLITACLVGQEFSEIIEINSYTNGLQETDGGNSICVYQDYVHILWQEMDSTYSTYVTTSADGGTTFAEDVRLDTTQAQLFGSLAIDAAGTLYAVWDDVDFDAGFIQGVYLSVSTDHGATFTPPLEISPDGAIPEIAVDGQNVYIAYLSLVTDTTYAYFFVRSTDGGLSFEEPYQLSPTVDYIKMDSPSVLVLDPSGTPYFAYNDGRRGAGSDIYLAVSTDQGQSFAHQQLVNVPTDEDPRLRTAPGIAFGGGYAYLVWREEVEQNGDGRRIMFSKASQGELAFTPEVSLVSGGYASPCITARNSEVYIGYPQGEMYGLYITKSGDYGETFPLTRLISHPGEWVKDPSIVVDSGNTLHAVWTLARDGNEDDVYYTQGQMIITALDERQLQPHQAFLLSSFPNPFNPSTTITYVLPENLSVSLVIYDVRGQVVQTLESEHQSAGWYDVVWNGDTADGKTITTGIYLAKLVAGNYSQVIKMLYLK